MAADSMNRPLGKRLTCRHLLAGTDDQRGHYYPRCGLGDAEDRRRWVAIAGKAEVEVVRSLQAAFDDFSWPHREGLVRAKAELLGSRGGADARWKLEQQVEEFLAATRVFVAQHAARFEDVGLPHAQLMEQIEDSMRAWMRSRSVADPGLGPASLAG
jgi:hypothetical protein